MHYFFIHSIDNEDGSSLHILFYRKDTQNIFSIKIKLKWYLGVNHIFIKIFGISSFVLNMVGKYPMEISPCQNIKSAVSLN